MREPEQWRKVLKLVGQVLWEYTEQCRQVLKLVGQVLLEYTEQ
jgi:hypothetical protein